jgi:8-amino-7-oxononanoate synthase
MNENSAFPFGLPPEGVEDLLRAINEPSGQAHPVSYMAARPKLGDAGVRETVQLMRRAAARLELDDPYFRVHDGIPAAHTVIDGRVFSSFAAYNYLGLNGDPRILEAAMAAMQTWGTSASASRIVSGERTIHRELEAALARLYNSEDCVTLVGGHATNVTVISHLVGRGDAIIHDQLAHNSIIQGAILSGAERISVAHGDLGALDAALGRAQRSARRTLVVIEGHYSMDGDIPDLAAILQAVRRRGAWLMVDEAHSLGVLGAQGYGLAQECGIDPGEVDIWMGTLSKALVGCGGYIAASHDIVDYLRCTAPGFVYSVGMPPPMAAASLKALEIMLAEPERVARLRTNASAFRAACQGWGLDTGASIGAAIVPVITGSSISAVKAAQYLFRAGINVQPILHPAVPERAARLRFFITAAHDPAQLEEAAGIAMAALQAADAERPDPAALAHALR